LAQQRRYRKFSAQQKLEIVLAGMRGDRSVREVCREHEIAETLYYGWRDKLLEGGKAELAGKGEEGRASVRVLDESDRCRVRAVRVPAVEVREERPGLLTARRAELGSAGQEVELAEAVDDLGVVRGELEPQPGVECPRFDGHLNACAVRPGRKDGVRAPHPTAVSRGVPP